MIVVIRVFRNHQDRAAGENALAVREVSSTEEFDAVVEEFNGRYLSFHSANGLNFKTRDAARYLLSWPLEHSSKMVPVVSGNLELTPGSTYRMTLEDSNRIVLARFLNLDEGMYIFEIGSPEEMSQGKPLTIGYKLEELEGNLFRL